MCSWQQMCSWSFLALVGHFWLLFSPLTRARGGEGYNVAAGEGQVVTRTGRVHIKIAQLYIRRQLYN